MEEKSRQLIIAIDGYSSCGKSTLAKLLAQKLNLLFIDTGAMYRAATLYALQNNLIDHEGKLDEEKLTRHLPQINISFDISQSTQNPIILLNDKAVTTEIRTSEVNANVSKVASNSDVRRKLVEEQRKLSQALNVVLDGRDIGTVVFPNATLKLFLTANADVRAKRRYNELKASNVDFSETLESVKANLLERDFIDSNRVDSPLIKAVDAVEIDNSEMTMEDQLDYVLELIQQHKISN
ncbi:MAG TPA: (d)CMP kinase [Crocinitomicaceae bacterium]|nr:(d)CMP kinase [Crocinitomicaceae bacterium]